MIDNGPESADARAAGPRRRWWKQIVVKAGTLIVLGVLFGLAYDWAAPRLYGSERKPGFSLGVVHGGLMPIALPSLLMGNDPPIYSPSQTGRMYKIGYIAGINLCGLLFFGLTFRKPSRGERSRQ